MAKARAPKVRKTTKKQKTAEVPVVAFGAEPAPESPPPPPVAAEAQVALVACVDQFEWNW